MATCFKIRHFSVPFSPSSLVCDRFARSCWLFMDNWNLVDADSRGIQQVILDRYADGMRGRRKAKVTCNSEERSNWQLFVNIIALNIISSSQNFNFNWSLFRCQLLFRFKCAMNSIVCREDWMKQAINDCLFNKICLHVDTGYVELASMPMKIKDGNKEQNSLDWWERFPWNRCQNLDNK